MVAVIPIAPNGAAFIAMESSAVRAKCKEIGDWERVLLINFESIVVEHCVALTVKPLLTRGPLHFLSSHGGQNLIDDFLCIAKQHKGVVFIEQRIIDAGVARCHRAFHDDGVAGFPDVEDGHSGDR